MNPELSQKRFKRTLVTIAFLMLAIACCILATLSISHETLYSPFGILAPDDGDPSFYIGISVYITIGVTLFTAALIRIGLDLSK